MADDIIHIALASDSNYIRGLLATMASMILFAKDKTLLQFHILDDHLTEEEKNRVVAIATRLGASRSIDFLSPDTERVVKNFKAYKDSHTAFLRLFLGELLPELSWVVYADVDTLWFRDVAELWKERDDKYPICWARDLPSICHGVHLYSTGWNPDFDESRYCCSGVALMNLSWFRREKVAERSFKFVEKWGTPFFVDQDILNSFFMKDCKIVDQCWNGMIPDAEAVESTVLHFNGLGAALRSKDLTLPKPFEAWRPLYAPWYRFYYDMIAEERGRPMSSFVRRMFWRALGMINPTSSPVRWLMSKTLSVKWQDHVGRQIFFAWLMRNAKWWRRW